MESAGAGRRGGGAQLHRFGRAAGMAGVVRARGPANRGSRVAAVPRGIGKRGGASASVRSQDTRYRNHARPGRRASRALPACAGCIFRGAAAMKLPEASAVPVTYAQLKWICACIALALLAHLEAVPIWLLVTVCAAAA